jgi:hypothetical protein
VLPDNVPLSRELRAKLRCVLPLIGTHPMREIFHELHVRLLANVMVDNREEIVAIYSLMLQGWWETRELEKGQSTQEPDDLTLSPSIKCVPFLLILRHFFTT